MKEYDVIVIGSGVGTNVVFKALASGLRVALVEKGLLGGTCLNTGCIPSKMLLFPADRVSEIRDSEKLGIRADIKSIDFGFIMKRMRDLQVTYRGYLSQAVEESDNLDVYRGACHFSSRNILVAAGTEILGKRIFIAAGSSPVVPPVKGLDETGFLNSESLLHLDSVPESLLIIGGGYVAVEYGHFFEAMGSRVTMVQRGARIIPGEEPEISGLLKEKLGSRINILTSTEAVEVRKSGGSSLVVLRNNTTGALAEVTVEKVLVAAGRKSNAGPLKVENAGIRVSEAGFIIVDDYLSAGENIWAFGDIIGRQMFTHAGDRAAEIAWQNSEGSEKKKMDFSSIPHAVFTWPQIASVGLTEEQARKRYDILVGKALYTDVVKGEAMGEPEGFAKAVVEKGTGKILGFHIIGPQASILIQEVANVVESNGTLDDITGKIHVFPSLSELVPEALKKAE